MGRTTSLDPLMANVTLPVKLPAVVGAKVTLSEAVPPACSVSGKARLLVVNPAPLKVAWLMVRSLPPELDRVTLLVWVAPILTLLNATDDGLSDNCPGVPVLPETVSDASISEFAPIKEMVRDRGPATLGLNCTLNGTLAPAPTISGAVIPRTCTSELEPVIELMVTEAAVLFDRVSGRVLLLPTATVPKLRVADVTTRLPPPLGGLPADKLWHPVRKNEHRKRKEPSQTLRNR